MKLDRNINQDGRGKYALIKLRETSLNASHKALAIAESKMLVVEPYAVDFGDSEDTDFFVIRLKDKYAAPALHAYGESAMRDDPEYGREIIELWRIASRHQAKQKPD